MRRVDRQLLIRLFKAAVEMNVKVVIIGGGWPCKDVSCLNSGRVGVTGERTGLFVEFFRVAGLVEEMCALHELMFLGFG